MDEALGVEAVMDGVSKAAIIRGLIARHTGDTAPGDSMDSLIGAFDYETGSIDDVVYGR